MHKNGSKGNEKNEHNLDYALNVLAPAAGNDSTVCSVYSLVLGLAHITWNCDVK